MLTSGTSQPVESTSRFAQKLFCEFQQAIIGHESQAMKGNVEAIHDMRVGIRRLRVALSNFAVCLSKSDRHRLQTNLKNLADALGGVRDLDVMIEALKDSQKNQPKEDKIVIGALIKRLRGRRRRQLQKLTVYLHGEEYSTFRSEFSGCGENQDEQAA